MNNSLSKFISIIGIGFILRVLIIFTTINVLYVEFRSFLREYDPSPKLKIYLKGAITNPEAFYLSSIELEKAGRLKDALVDLKLGLFLLESNGASPNFSDKFKQRIKYIESKIKDSNS